MKADLQSVLEGEIETGYEILGKDKYKMIFNI